MTVLGRKSDPFQQSTCQQLPVHKGPAAGGEALKYIVAMEIASVLALRTDRPRPNRAETGQSNQEIGGIGLYCIVLSRMVSCATAVLPRMILFSNSRHS